MTISRARPRLTIAVAHADPTAPASMIGIFISFTLQQSSDIHISLLRRDPAWSPDLYPVHLFWEIYSVLREG